MLVYVIGRLFLVKKKKLIKKEVGEVKWFRWLRVLYKIFSYWWLKKDGLCCNVYIW